MSSFLIAKPTKVVECYFVLPPDVKKDSSTEATCVLRALDICASILHKRSVNMPEHLVIEVHTAQMTIRDQGSGFPTQAYAFNIERLETRQHNSSCVSTSHIAPCSPIIAAERAKIK